ncbi:hypothetical protein POL68_21985 [Stigmatella sp. ncwal1]|uniref:Uncharacterized protein n=1 Tax=Stigmatella ashevillensis TaxID=2995309 RepID=A0ABT5DDD2_9BACT|nr:hypothetical protein [Stigmatella ashevillena]MDC0711155.1 hypothetical protein [Stigmatella ashevillena]
MCFVDVTREERPVLSPDDWFALILHGFDRKQGTAARPTLDCSGSPVVWNEPAADECSEAGPEVIPLPPAERLTEEDLVMETIQADVRLVWVIARRFSNGEALGPIGLVERTDKGIIVRALGSLRSFPQQAKLRLERSGEVDVLVAEGDQCTEEEPIVCHRFARLLPMRNGRFFAEAVTSEAGRCLGPAWFPLGREQLMEVSGGLQRKMEQSSTLKFTSEGILLNEMVSMHDIDPKRPSMPPRAYRRAQAERVLRVEGNRLVGTESSLWIQLMGQELRGGATPVEPVLIATPRPSKTLPAGVQAKDSP